MAVVVESRPELVGKRFLCVCGDEPPEKGRWRAGVIRTVSHRDSHSPELSVRGGRPLIPPVPRSSQGSPFRREGGRRVSPSSPAWECLPFTRPFLGGIKEGGASEVFFSPPPTRACLVGVFREVVTRHSPPLLLEKGGGERGGEGV